MRDFLRSARQWAVVMACLTAGVLGLERLLDARETRPLFPPAPEFPEEATWLNTDAPPTLVSLRGRVVLLDFWTFCCINCLHTLPGLAEMEETFRDEPVTVLGVHCAKFANEAQPEQVRAAIARHGIRHPVLLDPLEELPTGRIRGRTWDAYGVRTWPTLVLIDPEGRIHRAYAGEGHLEEIGERIRALLDAYRERGTLAEGGASPARLEERPADTLAFPGKILAEAAANRLYIADTGHHRVVACDLTGRVVAVYGSGEAGMRDGAARTAQLRSPQGLARHDRFLYVADTGNHAIRRIEIATGEVSTLCGTGGKADHYPPRAGTGTAMSLNSPWDLVAREGRLYVAMAGSHQIWRVEIVSASATPFAGTGEEERRDGVRERACFAQPSGLALLGEHLYVADSEISCVRRVDIEAPGAVVTVVGGDLFEYGDRDGKRNAVRLQHPLGIAAREGVLYLADTYNHRIKTIDPAQQSCTAYVGSGEPGASDDPAGFNEPGGVSVSGDTLYVADTNNHAIRAVDLRTGAVRTLAITFP